MTVTLVDSCFRCSSAKKRFVVSLAMLSIYTYLNATNVARSKRCGGETYIMLTVGQETTNFGL